MLARARLVTLAAALPAATALLLALPLVGVGATSTAIAGPCANHCYGIVEWDNIRVNGGLTYLTENCMNVPRPDTDFVDNEMWVDFSSNTWTEAGENYGVANGANKRFFWADQRPGNDYHEHYASYGPNTGQVYGDQIRWAGYPQAWDVSVGGFNGTSTGQPGPATHLQAGLETTDHNSSESAFQSGLAWYSTPDNAKHSPWGNSTYRYITPNSGVSVDWNTYPSSFGVGINSCLSSAAAPTGMPPAPPTGTTLTQPQLRDLATSFAARLGEPAPSNILAVETTRAAAVPTISGGETVNDPQAAPGRDVFAITAVGQFHADFAARPPGAAAPTGNALELVVDAHTGEITDWGLNAVAPSLASAGTITRP